MGSPGRAAIARRQDQQRRTEQWAQFPALLDELRDADAPQRAARLSEVRVTDPALADGVAALLDRQAAVDAEAFLEGSVFVPMLGADHRDTQRARSLAAS